MDSGLLALLTTDMLSTWTCACPSIGIPIILNLYVSPFIISIVERNTQVRRNCTTPHKTQMIDTTINLLVNRTECTNLSGTTLTLRLAVKSDNSSPAILFRDSEKLDATIKLSLTLPTHSCRCPHGRTKSCFTHYVTFKFP